MDADRPGFRNTATLVAPGTVQFESGLRLSNDESPGNAVSLEPALRYGVTPWLELRLASERYAWGRGLADLEPGVKLRLLDAANGARFTAVLKSTVPTGDASHTSGGFEPGIELIGEHDLPLGFAIAGTAMARRLRREEALLWQRSASLELGREAFWNLDTFVEGYVVNPKERGLANQWMINAGVSRQVGSLMRLDLSAGHSLSSPSREWFLVVGVSVRSAPR